MASPFSSVSLRSRLGFDGAAFFQAESVGVLVPFLSIFLRQHGWSYASIGLAVSLMGLGVFLMQTPAGILIDHSHDRRMLFAKASLAVGMCFALVPLAVGAPPAIHALLFVAGTAQSFFAPVLGALALALVGHRALQRGAAENQVCNHLGNIAAALGSLLLVKALSVSSLFGAIAAVSVIAGACVLAIKPKDLQERRVTGKGSPVPLRALLAERSVLALVISTALFHLANAPTMPMVALYLQRNGGSNSQVASVVLVAQLVMVPVAWLTGWAASRWGRKPIFAVAFIVLPVRIFLYSLVREPQALVALQALDGIAAGIYGVAIVAVCGDLTNGKGHFNALMGVTATALAFGGVVGPWIAGWVEDHLGFVAAFRIFAGIAVVAAVIFEIWVPETMPRARAQHLKAVA